MENIIDDKSHSNNLEKNPLSFLSNGIILDPKTAANLQVDTIKSYIKQSKTEGTYEKTIFLKHLLTNKINVPSNQMLSKAGKFYNYRSYGYETIYQQNKIQIADAINYFNKEQELNQETNNQNENGNITPSDELAKNYQEKKNAFRSFSPRDCREENQVLFAKNQSHKILNTTCLQFKKLKQEKINQINQKNLQNPNSKLSSAFTRLERNRLNELDHKYDNDTKYMNYYPIYHQVLPSPLPHKFLPIPSTQRREDVVMQPDCIIRGNLCEFKIRSITQEMKKYSDKIMSLLKKVEEIESQSEIKRDKSHKGETSKLRDWLDIIQEKKRQIGEEILEAQTQFIKARTEYEQLVKENIDNQEYINFNKIPDKPILKQMTINFKNTTGRGPLFPEQNVEDKQERLYNNYQEYEIDQKNTFYFKKMQERSELFKVNEGPTQYDHQKQFDNINYQKTFNLVHLSKEAKKVNYYTKHDYHAQQNEKKELSVIDWNKIVEGQQQLSNNIKTPQYTNIQKQMTRDRPHPHQIRTIKVNTNFYKTSQNIPSLKVTASARSYSPTTRRNQQNINNSSFTHIKLPF